MSKINLEQMQAASRRRYGVDSRRQRLAEKLAAKERRERRRAGLLGRAEMDIIDTLFIYGFGNQILITENFLNVLLSILLLV